MAHAHHWRTLSFLHWRVDPDELRPLVPRALDLDLHDGSAWVGLVLFTMPRVLVRGLRIPTAHSFHETNVRTYVRRGDDHGVYFFSLDAASALAVIGARSFWGLPYHYAAMRLHSDDGVIHYASERRWPGPRPAHASVSIRPHGPIGLAQPDTRAHFLLERYNLFTARNDRVTRGTVVHPPYPMQEAELVGCEESLIAASKIVVAGPPDDVRFSPGVDVSVGELVTIG